jgi:superfamily II DNA helicase RecQ
MKDQVDNMEKKGITEAVTINGLLDPMKRAKQSNELKMEMQAFFIFRRNHCVQLQLSDYF